MREEGGRGASEIGEERDSVGRREIGCGRRGQSLGIAGGKRDGGRKVGAGGWGRTRDRATQSEAGCGTRDGAEWSGVERSGAGRGEVE